MVSWSPPHTWAGLCLGWEGVFSFSLASSGLEGGGNGKEREP